MNPQHPVYVPTKGRWDSRLTIRALEEMGVPYHAVVQPQEYEQYAAVINPENILTLPFTATAAEGGLMKARNWILGHARSVGAPAHWQIDDNIRGFYRANYNMKVPVADGTIFRAAEDFMTRYENVAQGGFQYYMFYPRREKRPPFFINTRIYSCTWYRTDIDHGWEIVFNDDTDLSLRLLKDGWCTVLFNAFLANKMETMQVKGGNTGIYQGDGRLEMAQALVDAHPDVVRIMKRWGRYQHLVDYRPFKGNLLRRKPEFADLDAMPKVDNYGMEFQELDESTGLWVAKDPIEPVRDMFNPDPGGEQPKPARKRAQRRGAPAAPEAPAGPDWFEQALAGGLLKGDDA